MLPRRVLPLALACSALLPAGAAAAYPDGLDPSYGTAGQAYAQLGSNGAAAFGAAMDGDAVVLAGRADDAGQLKVFVARLTASGAPDPSFDGDGARLEAVGGFGGAEDVAVQPDGKPLVVGSDGSKALVLRYTAAGALDAYGAGGKLTFLPAIPGAAPTKAGITAVALDPATGSAIVVGTLVQDGRSRGWASRISPAGTVTATRVLDLVSPGDTVLDDVRVAGGHAYLSGRSFGVLGLVRLDAATLVPDAGFGGGDGLATVAAYTQDSESAVTVDGAGRAIVASSAGYGPLLWRLGPDGTPDAGFGADGVRRYETHQELGIDSAPSYDARGITVDAAGRLLVVGGAGRVGTSPTLSRILPNGDLDPAFAPGGTTQVVGTGLPTAVLLDPAQRILVTGAGSFGTKSAAFADRFAGGNGPSRMSRAPGMTAAVAVAGADVGCDPGAIDGATSFHFRWPRDGGSFYEGTDKPSVRTGTHEIGRTVGCEVTARFGAQRTGIVRAAGTTMVTAAGTAPVLPPQQQQQPKVLPPVAPPADTAARAFRTLKAGKHGAATLTLALTGRGTVTVAGTVGRTKAFSMRRSYGKAGRFTVKLTPTKALTRALRRKRTVRVRIVVALTPGGGRRTTLARTVTVRR